MRFGAFVLLAALAIGLPSNVPAAEGGSDPAGATAESDIELEEAADTLTGALQGQGGLRIQTLCTHCNSANVQVGGLAQDLVPILRNGYPVLGGLATSLIFSILPPDTVADAQVAKGPGASAAPAPAAGGTIRLTESTSHELPRLDHTAEVGTYDRGRGTMRFSGPLASWAAGTIVAGREKADPVDDDRDGFNDIGSVERDFVEAKLEFEAGRDHTVDAGFAWIDEENFDGRGAVDIIDRSFNFNTSWTREDTLLDRREYRAGWKWRLGGGRALEVKLLADNRHQTLRGQLTALQDPPFGSPEIRDRLVVREENRWGSIRYRHPLGLSAALEAGIDGEEQEVFARTWNLLDPIGSEPKPATDIVERKSGFTEIDVKLGSMSDLKVGVRYDDFKWGARDYRPPGIGTEPEPRYRSRSRTSPRMTFRLRPTDGWTLKLIAGSTMRAPKPIFSSVCCGQDYSRNVDTLSETGLTLGVEGTYQPSPDLRVSAYVARTDFDDHILRLVGYSLVWTQTIALANVPETRADTAEVALRWSPMERLTLDGSVGWLSHHNRGEEAVTFQVTPPSFGFPQDVVVFLDRIPYQPVRTGSLSASVTLPGAAQLTAGASYTGSMLIQQYADDPAFGASALLPELRATPGFWLANLSFRVPVTKELELIGGLDNFTDELQDDLGDPTADYNWGPLAGRSWRLGLRYSQRTF